MRFPRPKSCLESDLRNSIRGRSFHHLSRTVAVLNGLICLVGTCNASAKSVVPDPPIYALEIVAPTYPPVAVYAAISGTVTIRVTINKAGIVKSTKIIAGRKLLNSPARKAAKKWRFNSVSAHEERKRKVDLVFVYRIEPMNTPRAELTTRFYPRAPKYKVEVRRVVPGYR